MGLFAHSCWSVTRIVPEYVRKPWLPLLYVNRTFNKILKSRMYVSTNIVPMFTTVCNIKSSIPRCFCACIQERSPFLVKKFANGQAIDKTHFVVQQNVYPTGLKPMKYAHVLRKMFLKISWHFGKVEIKYKFSWKI